MSVQHRTELQIRATQRMAGCQAHPASVQAVPGGLHPLLNLQRTIGNQSVNHLLQAGMLQAKLTISQAGDLYEQEADRVADQVMRMPDPGIDLTSIRPLSLQRKCQGCEDEDKLQRQVQNPHAKIPSSDLDSVAAILRQGGQPLDAATRAFFEPRFGVDFSAVRLHTNSEAAASARSVNALAYTVGRDVVFNTGQYAPYGESGKRLLAHELTHVVQQSGARRDGSGPSVAVQPSVPRIQRDSLQDELNKELAAWAEKAGKTTDPKHKDYAFDLQEYAWSFINDPSGAGPLPKPKSQKTHKAWEKKFRKAALLAQMILAAEPKVTQKEERAALILNYLAQAGFTAEAVAQTASMSEEDQIAYIYEGVLQRLDKAGAAELATITEFFIDKKGQNNNPILEKLTTGPGEFARKLSNAQLTAILKPLIAAYEKEPFLIDLLSHALLRKPGYRQVFSDWMWKEGKGAFLFQILESEYFIEPEYGPTVLADVGELKMEKDMPWVYANKQKYYVGYLVQLGVDTGVKIDAPKNLKFNSIKAWLDANTENIGRALAKKYPDVPDKWIKVYEEIADIFFYHVSGRNINPDVSGKLDKLGPGAPAKMRLMADCDVLSTYAMRFFNSVRDPANPAFKAFDPIGYMAIDPKGGEGHSVALMRRKGDYYVINNKEVNNLNIHESKPDEKKEQAIQGMKRDALQVYDTEPASYKVYYADAGADGAMPMALMRIDEPTRRTDLEP